MICAAPIRRSKLEPGISRAESEGITILHWAEILGIASFLRLGIGGLCSLRSDGGHALSSTNSPPIPQPDHKLAKTSFAVQAFTFLRPLEQSHLASCL